ncbi:MAG: hypothetical protein C5B52_05075 [Bacteroidetes bacterium]|nr:MAG: hypothetical protein C5B52_05075 [Bacteroidota bacterium]
MGPAAFATLSVPFASSSISAGVLFSNPSPQFFCFFNTRDLNHLAFFSIAQLQLPELKHLNKW